MANTLEAGWRGRWRGLRWGREGREGESWRGNARPVLMFVSALGKKKRGKREMDGFGVGGLV